MKLLFFTVLSLGVVRGGSKSRHALWGSRNLHIGDFSAQFVPAFLCSGASRGSFLHIALVGVLIC